MAIATSVPPLPFVPQEFHGAPIVVFYAAYAGDPGEGEAALRPLREVGEPAVDLSDRMPFVALHEIANELFPSGNRYSWHSLYATEDSDDLIDRVAVHASRRPGPEASIEIWHLGGAVSDVAPDARLRAPGRRVPRRGQRDLARPGRGRGAPRVGRGGLGRPPGVRRHAGGVLSGGPGLVAGEEHARMAFGENLGRLADLKAEYDSENLLNSSLNVEPAC